MTPWLAQALLLSVAARTVAAAAAVAPRPVNAQPQKSGRRS
jgi:hypothetical protein